MFLDFFEWEVCFVDCILVECFFGEGLAYVILVKVCSFLENVFWRRLVLSVSGELLGRNVYVCGPFSWKMFFGNSF